MKRIFNQFIFILVAIVFSSQLSIAQSKERIILIKTQYGNIKVKLYDETPLHRDNMIKLASQHYFDSLLFHRIIKNFMIQGGDPDSKNAKPGVQLGNGGPEYTINAEFNPKLFHKKGAIAAARTGDNINPEKKSSGSQFYIVQGKVYTNEELNSFENRMNVTKKQEIVRKFVSKPENLKLKNQLDSLLKIKDQTSIRKFFDEMEVKCKDDIQKAGVFKFSDEQRKIYTSIGGTPNLDGNYTVFGEVIEGLEVIDKIAELEKDKNDRPLKDVKMSISIIK